MRKKLSLVFGLLLSAMFIITAFLTITPTKQASAHGSMQSPVSRIYNCFLEGAETPKSDACKAAVALGGTQGLYDWMGVRQGNAAGNHQALIPDGKLCSANTDEYKGMDLPRADWVSTSLPTSGSYNFHFMVTAPHMGTMYLYVTKNGYNPTMPLKWSDLEATPFSTHGTDTVKDGPTYTWTAQLPTGKSGPHLIYMIWQRSDSTEAFYSCSDVFFGGTPSTSTPTAKPAGGCPDPTWVSTAIYTTGMKASWNGQEYQAKWWNKGDQPDISTTGAWGNLGACTGPTPTMMPMPTDTPMGKATNTPSAKPTNTPVGKPTNTPVGKATNTPVGKPTNTPSAKPTNTPVAKPTNTPTSGYPAWAPGVSYTVGQIVSYNGANYKCLQAHTSQTGWEPSNAAALWQKI